MGNKQRKIYILNPTIKGCKQTIEDKQYQVALAFNCMFRVKRNPN